MEYIDMHCHTNASDGSLRPKDLLLYAIRKGLKGIAITDHDTIDGVKEVLDYSKGINDFYFIPGVEISTEYLREEVHILGYAIDIDNRVLNELLKEMKDNRETRSVKMIAKLKDIGFDITYEEVKSLAKGVVGRPHIGQVLINKGYVKSMQEVFDKYLRPGGAAYVPRFKITPSEAINILIKAGGVPVLAHPGFIKNKQIINKVISYGIQGIEVYYPSHSPHQIAQFRSLADINNLITTGGSDFHSVPDETTNKHDLGAGKVSTDLITKILDLI